MGGGGGGFLQYMDSLAMTFGIVLFLWTLHHAAGRHIHFRHAAWLGASMIALFEIFLVGRVAALAINPYMTAVALMGTALFAAGFLSLLDERQKITPYYLVYSMIGVVAYSLAAHYGKVTGQIALVPMLIATALPAVILLLVLPVVLMARQKAGVHALWVPLGTILLCAAGYYMVGTTNETIALGDNASSLINTLLAAGYFCLTAGFVMVKGWLAADAAADSKAA